MGTTFALPARAGGTLRVGPAPRATDEAELFTRDRAGDAAAREELVRRFLPLARSLARRYRHSGEPLDDLVQVASVALVKALDRFDPARGVAFKSFAIPTIVGELKRHLRDTRWAAYVPQRMRERVLAVNHAAETLRRTLGRSPTAAELAREARLDTDEVADALRAASAFDAVSLDGHAFGGDDAAPNVADGLGSEEERYDLVEYTATIAPALKALPARQRAILWLRFHEDMTQSQIAARMGMSQMHVSRLLRQTLERLREVARARHSSST